jgi:hypothetical protein
MPVMHLKVQDFMRMLSSRFYIFRELSCVCVLEEANMELMSMEFHSPNASPIYLHCLFSLAVSAYFQQDHLEDQM